MAWSIAGAVLEVADIPSCTHSVAQTWAWPPPSPGVRYLTTAISPVLSSASLCSSPSHPSDRLIFLLTPPSSTDAGHAQSQALGWIQPNLCVLADPFYPLESLPPEEGVQGWCNGVARVPCMGWGKAGASVLWNAPLPLVGWGQPGGLLRQWGTVRAALGSGTQRETLTPPALCYVAMRGTSPAAMGNGELSPPLSTRYSSSSFSRCACSRSCASFSSAPRAARSSSESCLWGNSICEWHRGL